jgi:hypothetical protein
VLGIAIGEDWWPVAAIAACAAIVVTVAIWRQIRLG